MGDTTKECALAKNCQIEAVSSKKVVANVCSTPVDIEMLSLSGVMPSAKVYDV
jgi:hypothetical protein